MSDTSQPDRGGRRRTLSRRWLKVGIGAMALGLVATASTVARPTVTSLVQNSSSATAIDVPAVAAAPTPPSSITLPVPERHSPELGRDGIAQLRKELSRATAKAEASARILAAPAPVKVAYFNMLGCYHTDRDEPHYGHMAYHFGSCGHRMPQQYAWLASQGISIAGVGEFQGKAWRVLAGINGGVWDIFARGQSGPYGQNPVVWRTTDWSFVAGEELRHSFYNCANGGTCRGSSSMVRLKHKATGRELYVLNTHHTSDGRGGGRRAANRSMELSRINAVKASGIPVIYMGDFNEVGGAHGHIGRYLRPAFSGMGIDQIWGTSNIDFEGGHYDGAFRRWTDHGSGIAVVTANIPGIPPQG